MGLDAGQGLGFDPLNVQGRIKVGMVTIEAVGGMAFATNGQVAERHPFGRERIDIGVQLGQP